MMHFWMRWCWSENVVDSAVLGRALTRIPLMQAEEKQLELSPDPGDALCGLGGTKLCCTGASQGLSYHYSDPLADAIAVHRQAANRLQGCRSALDLQLPPVDSRVPGPWGFHVHVLLATIPTSSRACSYPFRQTPHATRQYFTRSRRLTADR